MSLGKSYRNAAPDAALFTIPLAIILGMAMSMEDRARWLTPDSMVIFMFSWAVIYSLWMCIMCVPIFFCKFEKVKGSKFLTILAWFAAPMGSMGLIFLYEYQSRIQIGYDSNIPFYFVLCLNLPFLIALIWSYWKYTQIQSN